VTKTRVSLSDWKAVAQENDVATKLQSAHTLASYVLSGELPALILCGAPGCGKTYTINSAIKNAGKKSLPGNPARYDDLYNLFADAQRKNEVLVLEEADQIFRNSRQSNVIKLATDVTGKRVVKEKGVVYNLRAKLFIGTNLDLTNIANFPNHVRDDIAAITSRTAPIVFPTNSSALMRLELWEYACYLAIVHGLLRPDPKGGECPSRWQNAALEFFTANVFKLDEVSVRRLLEIMRMIRLAKGDANVWRQTCQRFLTSPPALSGATMIPAIPTIITPVHKAARPMPQPTVAVRPRRPTAQAQTRGATP
jgi:hypothetical protein